MARIRVSTVIDAEPAHVWAVLGHIESHVDWMVDASEIRITSGRREGVGTTFECDSRFGPIRLTDTMTITAWEPEHTMSVTHAGTVNGTGSFTLIPAGPGRTELRWQETLEFPIWMGGPMRDPVGRRMLELVWRSNLKRLKKTIEADVAKSGTIRLPSPRHSDSETS